VTTTDQVAPYDLLAVPLTITDDAVARGLLQVADTICMHQEGRGHIERRWAFDKAYAAEHGVKFRRERVTEHHELKLQIDSLRAAVRNMLAPMMNLGGVPVGERYRLLDAAAERIIAVAAQERQHARDTGERQWYQEGVR
jgi:hypothetical protein